MKKIEILSLADYPEYIELCAAWVYGEWGCLIEGRTLDYYIEKYTEYASKSGIPHTVIARVNNQIVGTATLRDYDLADNNDNRKPWMTLIYVHPTYRNIGVGAELVKAIENYSAKEAVETLYLYTSHAKSLYQKLNWNELETIKNPINEGDVDISTIMEKKLTVYGEAG